MTELWQQHWPDCPPVGYKLRDPYRDLWVRFHSLPESKRYAEDESEYAVVLERHNTVLDEVFAGGDVYMITPVWATEAEVPPSQPDGDHWQTLLVEDDPDPEFRTYRHLFAARQPWRYGCLDELLRDIADDKVAGVLITDTQMRRVYYPYDGGADVFLATPGERDRTRDRHADWLSSPRRVSDVAGSPPPPTSPDSDSQPTEADAECCYADESEEVFGLALVASVEPPAAGQP